MSDDIVITPRADFDEIEPISEWIIEASSITSKQGTFDDEDDVNASELVDACELKPVEIITFTPLSLTYKQGTFEDDNIDDVDKTEYQSIADAFAQAQESLAGLAIPFADWLAAVETLGGDPSALADAVVKLAEPPRYPDWRVMLDAILITLMGACITVLAATPGEWLYKVQCIGVAVVALVWLLSLEERWKHKRELW